MTAAILTTIRQQLRKRWARCVVCLCALIVGYVASAGSMIGLAFHPRVAPLPFGGEIREATFTLYTPAILISGSRYCPKAVPQFLSWSIGEQRKAVFTHTMAVARRGFQPNPNWPTSSSRAPKSILSSLTGPKLSLRGWQSQQLLSFGTALYRDQLNTEFAEADSAKADGPGTVPDSSLRPEGPSVQSLADPNISDERPALQASERLIKDDNPARWAGLGELLAPWAGRQCGMSAVHVGHEKNDLAASQLTLEVGSSSRLGGSLALPGDSNWLPLSVLLTTEEIAGLPSEKRDEKSGLCFPTRDFPKRHEPSGPFIFTVLMTR